MNRLTKSWKSVMRESREKGSALLVSLMVMVGLSLLGLGFVAVSETESAISVNERNYAQTLAVAEAGARIAVEWFQAPIWARTQGLAPENDVTTEMTIKRTRTVAKGPSSTYTGVYKPAGTYPNLFDRPYRQVDSDRFYGTEGSADIFIRSTDAGYPREFLNELNALLFSTAEGIRITEILIFAPPIIGGEVNAGGFVEKGTRYGMATIKVTAQKTQPTNDPNGRVIAQRSVKMIVSEWPFPGPQGPIQSNANISTGGAFGVHWGKMTSQGTMDIKRPLIGLPWTDAYQSLHFERGFDQTGAGTSTNSYPLVAPPEFVDGRNWAYELLGQSVEDPWYEARARGRVVNVGGAFSTLPHPYKYDDASFNLTVTPDAGWCNWFQLQSFSDGTDHREVIFPRIDYDFWKEIAVQGSSSGQEGVYYLRPVGTGEDYTNGIETKTFAKWVNTARAPADNPARPGFFFFDTTDGLSPQGPGTPTNLANDIHLNASDDGATFQMQGFFYLNARIFGTQGIRGPAGLYGFPGEPYRDVGHRPVDPVSGAFIGTGLVNASNGEWDYQDLPSGPNPGRFDVVVAARAWGILKPSGVPPASLLMPVPYTPGCNVGVDCSEPHEPYLNIIYPTNAKAGVSVQPVPFGWQLDAGQSRSRKGRKADASLPNCGLPADYPLCTSNGYDRDGGMVTDLDPVLNGVFYNEGDFDSEGNAIYFGSLLINGSVIGTGTPEVWFDERLIKGMWPPPEMPIPRVYISAHQTDQ